MSCIIYNKTIFCNNIIETPIEEFTFNEFSGPQCEQCKKEQGYELKCNHVICTACTKRYILNGIALNKWKNEPVTCPISSNCKTDLVSEVVFERCYISTGMERKLKHMQNEYVANNDPNLSCCPSCKSINPLEETLKCKCKQVMY